MGWSRDPGPPKGGEIPRQIFLQKEKVVEKILSIFIDESGDFGDYEVHSPYYIVTMVLHNQDKKIKEKISILNRQIEKLGYGQHAIHSGPLIRRESIYKDDLMENRKALFNSLFNFVRVLDINYDYILVKKKECLDIIQLTTQISRALKTHLNEDSKYWKLFDKIIVYYDNGQIELTKILTSVFNAIYDNVEFRKVKPKDYVLFQVADLIYTLELVSQKFSDGVQTKWEKEFFKSKRDFNKNYLKPILRKHIKSRI